MLTLLDFRLVSAKRRRCQRVASRSEKRLLRRQRLRQRQRIHQKLPQAPESVLDRVWTILNAANEDNELYAEFECWEAASDEDEAQIEIMLATKNV